MYLDWVTLVYSGWLLAQIHYIFLAVLHYLLSLLHNLELVTKETFPMVMTFQTAFSVSIIFLFTNFYMDLKFQTESK